jgi:hypothetical protein
VPDIFTVRLFNPSAELVVKLGSSITGRREGRNHGGVVFWYGQDKISQLANMCDVDFVHSLERDAASRSTL